MAAVQGPSTARHPSPFSKRQPKISARPSGSSSSHSVDPYYGHEETAKLCARFVTHLFACPDLPPLSTAVPPAPSPPLANFIAYALHRTRLHSSVTFAALYLLQRLKARFPAARGSSGHRLFISAFMIASKVICDDTYSNKSWSIVGQGMFALREINQMEREMCSYLEWQLNIEPSALKEFEQKVRRDFKGLGPYPTYVLPSPAPSPMPSTTPYTAQATGTAPAPSFAARSQQPPSTSPPKPIPPPVPVHAGAPPYSSSSAQPSSASSPSTPETPDTPESSMSTSTSPASSAPPSTPLGYEDNSVRVVGSGTIGTPIHIDQASPTTAAHMPAPVPSATSASAAAYAAQRVPAVLKKAKCGDIFARASPCVW
ncbi:cyclin-like protein [Lentinus tigrinus ALCF2SS1-7]|uniref:Cyclin-like protein n=1 Tax=Lentinus tigrinus ALCF2SS1-6 TaxID=1328759 RepID=A0A5C2S2P3_9APHY|nr:cyclin-like protein [Lentinus tigrinus ALCF2SS1-6]RPD71867.1 cyclin-like protein [Lentinus tigrinus ALCF2SS1-7]